MLVSSLTTACAPNVEKVTDKLMTNTFDSVSISGFVEGHLVFEGDGQSYKLDISNSYEGELDQVRSDNPVKMHFIANNKMSLADILDSASSTNTYYTDGYVYAENEDNVIKEASPSMAEAINERSIEALRFQLSNLMYKAEAGKKTEEMLGENCYVFTYRLQGTELYNFINDIASETGYTDELNQLVTVFGSEINLNQLFAYTPVDVKAYISKESSYMVAVDFDMTNMDIDGVLRELNLNYSQLSDALGVHLSNINVRQLIFGLNFFEYDNSEVSLPEGYESATEQQIDMGMSLPSDMNLSNANGETLDTETEEVERQLPLAGKERELQLKDASGASVVTVSIPDGSNYYPAYSSDSAVNIISEDYEIDCYISAGLDEGYGDPYFKSFIDEGSFASDYSEEIITTKIPGASAKYYESTLTGIKYVVVNFDSGKTVLASFNSKSLKGYKPQEIADLVDTMIK